MNIFKHVLDCILLVADENDKPMDYHTHTESFLLDVIDEREFLI